MSCGTWTPLGIWNWMKFKLCWTNGAWMELTTSSKVCPDIFSCGVAVKYRSAECVLLRFGILEGGGGETWVVLSHVRYSRKISLVAFLRRILKQSYDRNDSNVERMALGSSCYSPFSWELFWVYTGSVFQERTKGDMHYSHFCIES